MILPCIFVQTSHEERIGRIIWGPNREDLFDDLRFGRSVRFGTEFGEMYLDLISVGALWMQDDPNDRHNWFLTGTYYRDGMKKSFSADYSTYNGEGWIKLC